MSSYPQQPKGKKKPGLNSVISWGASVVIIGLMFKILHWKGGEMMIAAGLMTEAFLFAILGFAAFEVPEEKGAEAGPDNKADNINDLLSTAISPAVIQKLSKGFENFTKTVESVNTVVNAVPVAQNMIKEIETTTGDLKKFRDHVTGMSANFDQFGKTIQSINQMSVASQGMLKDFESAGTGMKAFSKNIVDMNASFDQFSKTLGAINAMTTSSQTMLKEFEAATNGLKAYNKNILDLNKIYSAQLEAFRKN
jgi:gliding motility-associated protein GldL